MYSGYGYESFPVLPGAPLAACTQATAPLQAQSWGNVQCTGLGLITRYGFTRQVDGKCRHNTHTVVYFRNVPALQTHMHIHDAACPCPCVCFTRARRREVHSAFSVQRTQLRTVQYLSFAAFECESRRALFSGRLNQGAVKDSTRRKP